MSLMRWAAMPSGRNATDQDVAHLITLAESATRDEVQNELLWAQMTNALRERGASQKRQRDC